MNTHLPKPLQQAHDQGIQFFMGEHCEWKLEHESDAGFIEKVVGCPVYAFANNGYGDHLFLVKKSMAGGFEADVYEYFHEGPEINRIPEDLETLLGLKDRPASSDAYPKAVYETGEPVRLEDRVQVKVWLEFWKGWQDGVVEYVPGISKRNPEHEYNGLKWVVIRFGRGTLSPVVDPTSGTLRKV